MPRWLELQAELDYIYWRIEDIRRTVTERSGLDAAIDQATGREAALREEAEELMARGRELRREYDALVASDA